MKKIAVIVSSFAFLVLPLAASAHEHATYQIGDGYYQIVVGSLNEPVAVDDKTGIDLTVTKCTNSSCMATMSADGEMDGPAGSAVTGLQDTLKAELVAGGQKKTVSLSPQYGKPGAYSAAYYPTVATTLSYHFTGTINGTPVDLSYSCLPVGATKAADDATSKKISDGVTQLSIGGGFGCPMPKEALGFPEASASVVALENSSNMGAWGIGFGVLGVILAGFALMRKKS